MMRVRCVFFLVGVLCKKERKKSGRGQTVFGSSKRRGELYASMSLNKQYFDLWPEDMSYPVK